MSPKLLVVLLVLSLHLNAVTINGLTFSKASYERFEKAEATFSLGATYSNPYDSSIVQVDAEVTAPNGVISFVPCFYYVPCTYTAATATYWNAAENTGNAKWMLRYCPKLTGTYSVRIRVLDGATSWSGSVSFTSTTSTRKGFVRIDATNNQFMRFDNGTPYYPVGTNLCWNDGRLVSFYKEYFDNLDANGVTWTRYWLTDFARQALEWRSGHWSGFYNGLGRYSQQAAGVLDSVINLCEAKDVYLQLVLQQHGQFSNSTNPEWVDNPHNNTLGGPCANPADFFTNATSRGYTKKMYRYVVARWGYSTNVMSWELFNEVEFSEGTDTGIDSWHDEMSRYLKYQDPNDHLVNTSSGGDNSTLPLFDNNSAMDQMQWHTYSGGINKVLREESETFIPAFTKPVMCGEFGLTTTYPAGGAHPDNWADHVRKSMWTQMMSEAPAMFWYWDTYLKDKNLFTVFKPLADYLQGEDFVVNTGGGARREIKFSNNPLLAGTIYVTPTQGSWGGTNIPNPFTSVIDNNGNASNTAGLHRYLHGSWQGTRNREISFTVNFQTGGSAVQLDVSSVSASGTKGIQVYVDGALQTTWTPAAGVLTYTGIAAGTHTIRLYNSGEDWVEFNNIRFTNVSFYRCTAYGYTGNAHAYGYVNDISYGDYADPAGLTNVTGAVLRVGPLTAGSYSVQFWNPQTGATSSGGTLATTLDSLTISLPSFKKDIAYKITPVALPIRILNLNGNFEEEKILLQWTTVQEEPGVIFYIERLSGNTFENIGKQDANGIASSYFFTDENPLAGENVYRVRWQENGESFFSALLHMNASHEVFSAGPLPATDHLDVQLSSFSDQQISLKIYSVKGELLQNIVVNVLKGNNTVVIRLIDLSPGMYVLQRSDTGGIINLLVG